MNATQIHQHILYYKEKEQQSEIFDTTLNQSANEKEINQLIMLFIYTSQQQKKEKNNTQHYDYNKNPHFYNKDISKLLLKSLSSSQFCSRYKKHHHFIENKLNPRNLKNRKFLSLKKRKKIPKSKTTSIN